MTNRIQRVNSLLEREIGKILLRDFAFSPEILVTLTRVDTSSNLIEVKVFVSVYPENKTSEAFGILNKNVYNIQQEINKLLRMRPIPKIKFVSDKNEAEAGRVEELLAQLKKEKK